MSDNQNYVTEFCDMCRKPIGYKKFATDGKGEHPVHASCLEEADMGE